MAEYQIFDGHNDLLYRLAHAPERRAEIFLTGEKKGHLDLPRMREAGFAGGMFAIYVGSPDPVPQADKTLIRNNPPYDMPLPAAMSQAEALPQAMAQAGLFKWMERASNGGFKACVSTAEIREAMAAGAVAGVLHMEGCEPIDAQLDALYVFYDAGLRSLGPVWSRPTAFAHGVPFRFPADPDTGPGLTDAGKALVRACNQLKVMIDLSHMNAAGFRDVMAISDAPLVATHSNAWNICQSTRNLTDWQLAAIRESGGMVGLNFAAFFLRPDGRELADCGWEPFVQHLDYLIAHLGEDHVGLGSDFDGALVPDVMGDVTGLPKLMQVLKDHGYGEDLLQKLAHQNWLRVLERSIG